MLDPSEYTMEMQLAEIERRRAEITVRYQQRLDYLRARLKGAEIHERLLRSPAVLKTRSTHLRRITADGIISKESIPDARQGHKYPHDLHLVVQ